MDKLVQSINWRNVMVAGFVIMVIVAITTILTSFWGWVGAIACIAGWRMSKKQDEIHATCPPPPTE